MKKIFLTTILTAACVAAAAQGQPYDSLTNFLGDKVERYVGQVLYLKNSAEARGNNGYAGFAISPDFDLGPNGRNVFRSVQSKTPIQYVSNYELMAGRYFSVDDVVTRTVKAFTRGGLTHYLELTDMASGDRCYMSYEMQNPECFRNVIVVGYYEKMRDECIGQIYVYTAREPEAYRSNTYVGLHDYATHKLRTDIPPGSEWNCTDVAIEEGNDFRLIGVLESPIYGKVYTLVTDLRDMNAANAKFTTPAQLDKAVAETTRSEALQAASQTARLEEALAKFGEVNGPLLARGEVKNGMTKEMCRWAFGALFNVLTVNEDGENTEQWSYTDGLYLYFRGDELIRSTKTAAYRDDTKYLHKQGAK